MKNAIRFEDFTYEYPRSGKGLNRVSFEVPQGSFTVLTGANGSGKTTACLAMTGLVPHYFGGRMAGKVWVDGMQTAGRAVAEISKDVGLVMDDYESQLMALTVFDEVAFALENGGVPAAEIRIRVRQALEEVGLGGLEERELSQLSGGQRQRLAVASVITSAPKVLILDEPASALDPEGAEELYAFLARLNQETGMTVIVAEHDLARALPHADQIIVMENGAVAAIGKPSTVFSAMLQHGHYIEAIPAVRRLQAILEESGYLEVGADWRNDADAVTEINQVLEGKRRLSLSA